MNNNRDRGMIGYIIVSLILLVGISLLTEDRHPKRTEMPRMEEQIVIASKDTADTDMIMYNKISFEGHTYIVFDIGGNKAGVTHDENCRCKKKK